MNSILKVLNKLKNQLPYFLLIALYFFLVNLEARKGKDYERNIRNENNLLENKSIAEDEQLRIKIPVIPYKH